MPSITTVVDRATGTTRPCMAEPFDRVAFRLGQLDTGSTNWEILNLALCPQLCYSVTVSYGVFCLLEYLLSSVCKCFRSQT